MLLGLEPGYRRRDDRLDRRVFATVLAFIGGGLVFLLAVVSLSFPHWIDPRAFVARLLPSVGNEAPDAAPARPLPVLSANAIGFGFSPGTFGDTTDNNAAAVSPPDETPAGLAAASDGEVLEQPRTILVPPVQNPMIDSAETPHDSRADAVLAGSIGGSGSIADPGGIMEPEPVIDQALVVEPAPTDPAPIVDSEPAPGVNLPCAVDPAVECAAPPAPTPPGSPGGPPKKTPPGHAPGGPPGLSNPHPPIAPPGRPSGR